MMVGYGGHRERDQIDLPSYNHNHRRHNSSTASMLNIIEKRTQKTYRYGIGLVCIGATLNWLGFAQGNSYVDPLRYLGVASVISGSFCVCLAMCRWLGRSTMSSSLEEDSLSTGEVHVFNVAIPMFMSSSSANEDFRPTKPPDYVPPPNYNDAIKLSPGSLIEGIQPQCHTYTPASCEPSPSHSHSTSPELEPRKSIDATLPSLGSTTPPPPYQLMISPTKSFSLLPSGNDSSYLNESTFTLNHSSMNFMNNSNNEDSNVRSTLD